MKGKHWRMYIEHEHSAGNADAVEALFKRCLRSTPMVELWRRYVRHVTDATLKLPNPFPTVTAAYDLAVSTVGTSSMCRFQTRVTELKHRRL
jgi:hypothetical protein